MRRQAAGRADKVRARQGYERRKLLQKFQWGKLDTGGAVGPRPVESVNEIPVSILLKPLKRHSPSGCIANQTFQLITPMCRNPSVGVQGKAVDAGTTGSLEFGTFAFNG